MWQYQHRLCTVHQLPALKDNYIFILESHIDATLAVIDPTEAPPVQAFCDQLGKQLTHILNTHHHWDHTGGNLELQARYQCQVIGAAHDTSRIPGITRAIEKGPLQLNQLRMHILDIPGHTLGHIAFYLEDHLGDQLAPILFCGDTLFGAGCGRLFEGSYEQMLESLNQLAHLPASTRVYCAHEYTLSNLAFAESIQQQLQQPSSDLAARIQTDQSKRHRQQPTIPSTIALEKATNPFLRSIDPAFVETYAQNFQIQTNSLAVFRHLRELRNHW